MMPHKKPTVPNHHVYEWCPACGSPKRGGIKRCAGCAGATPLGSTLASAKYGIDVRVARAMGGIERLDALDADARALLLRPAKYGYSQTVMDGGMKARGMQTRKRGIDTQAEARGA